MLRRTYSRKEVIVLAELIGIMGTLFVLLSFLMREPERIRKVNIIGAALFVVYGLMIQAYSTWILNAALIGKHLYFLIKQKKKGNFYEKKHK